MSPRVSVLMTVYEAGEFLQQAIDSVLTQTFQDFELVIIDDDSRDPEVQAVLNGLLDDDFRSPRLHRVGLEPEIFIEPRCPFKDPRITRILRRVGVTPERRAASVRYATNINTAFEHSSGDLITYLCGDDYYMPDRLERMVDEYDGWCDDKIAVYGSQRLEWVPSGTVSLRPTTGPLVDAYGLVDLNSVMHSRRMFEAAGGWQDTPATDELWRCADGVFWRRLHDQGVVFQPVPGWVTDVKRYRKQGVDDRVIQGLTPWL